MLKLLKSLQFFFYAEILLACRRSHAWLYPLGFFMIVITLFPLALSPDKTFLEKTLPGGIWLAALFACVLASETLLHADQEDGYLEQLLVTSLPLNLLLTTKFAAQWCINILPLILITPLLGVLFGMQYHIILALFLSLLFGTPIVWLIGCFVVALTYSLKKQGTLLGLLILPLIMPILILGINIVNQARLALPTKGSLAFLIAVLILTTLTLPYAIAAALRLNLEH